MRRGVTTSPVADASLCPQGREPAYGEEWPPLLLLTPPRLPKAGSLHMEGSGHLSCCSRLLVSASRAACIWRGVATYPDAALGLQEKCGLSFPARVTYTK